MVNPTRHRLLRYFIEGEVKGNSKGQDKPPDYVANSLHEVVEWIIKDAKSRSDKSKASRR